MFVQFVVLILKFYVLFPCIQVELMSCHVNTCQRIFKYERFGEINVRERQKICKHHGTHAYTTYRDTKYMNECMHVFSMYSCSR